MSAPEKTPERFSGLRLGRRFWEPVWEPVGEEPGREGEIHAGLDHLLVYPDAQKNAPSFCLIRMTQVLPVAPKNSL